MKNIEQELKLALSEREYSLLKTVGGDDSVLQVNHYFSSKAMAKTDMLRIRQTGDQYELCLKQLLSGKSNIWVSNEFNAKIDENQFCLFVNRGITSAELKSLVGVDLGENFLFRGKLETLRTKFVLAGFNVELDKNTYLDCVDFELECECNDVLKFNTLTSYLQYHFGIVIAPSMPKSQRFFNALNDSQKF